MVRRNLSGIFIFDKFDTDQTVEPTCFEDCQEATQDEFLDSLSTQELKVLSKKLASTIRYLGREFDISTDF